MPKVAILYIAVGRYITFWKDFYESCEKYLLNADKHYFVWTDATEFPHSDNANVTIVPDKKLGWPYDTLLRFAKFESKKKELAKFDYIYFFNANFEFVNYVDLTEIAPREWNDGLVAGLHPGRNGDIFAGQIDRYPYERRPESTAYIPYGKGRNYVCGAFNGGTSAAYLKMIATLSKNVQKDLDNGIVACVDDESHLNAYLVDKNYLLAGREYGFPEHLLDGLKPTARVMVRIISRHKDSPKYGGAKWLRGQTDKKMMNNWFSRNVLAPTCHVVAVFIPVRKWRSKVRILFG